MKVNIKYFLFYLLFFAVIFIANAQSDSLIIEEDSIVYINEGPIIINKSITHEQEVFKNWFIEFYGGLFLHKNSYCTCENLIAYKTEMNKSLNPSFGNVLGLSLMNVSNKRRLIYSVGLSHISFRENFSQQKNDSSQVISFKNNYSYVDMNIGLGYWLLRKREFFSIIINTKLMASKLLMNTGNTIDYIDVYKIISNQEANREANWVLSGVAGVKILALNNKRIKIFVEPFTRANFTSVLDYKKHFYQRRWATGLNFGIIYTL